MTEEQLKGILGEIELPADIAAKIIDASTLELTEAHKGTTNKTLTAVDSLVGQLFGIEKESGEKTTDLVTRAAKVYKEQTTKQASDEVAEMQNKLKEAEKSGASSDDIKKLQKSLVEKETQLTELKTNYDKELGEIKRNSQINQIKSGIKINADISKPLLDSYLQTADRLARDVKTVEINGKTYASNDGIIPIVIADKNQTFEDYIGGLYSEVAVKETPTGNGKPSDAGQVAGYNLQGSPASQRQAFETLLKAPDFKKLTEDEQRDKRVELVQSDQFKALPEY